MRLSEDGGSTRLDLVGLVRPRAEDPRSRGGLAPGALKRTRDYVDAQLTEKITVEAMAEAAGLSRSHFARAFKRSLGVTPHAYILQRRLERAEKLLVETDLPISRIAVETGFSDQSHFCRHFRRSFGMSPGLFRAPKA